MSNKFRTWTQWFGLALVAMTIVGCDQKKSERRGKKLSSKSVMVEVKPVEEFISKTPNARIIMQPSNDPHIVIKNVSDKIAFIDVMSGDMLLMQEADGERRIEYFAYVTKDRDLVRVFMTQFGGGHYGKKWKVFPIRVWNIEDPKHLAPAAAAARPRATLERLAKFLSSDPDFKDKPKSFMLIDAPVSAQDPL